MSIEYIIEQLDIIMKGFADDASCCNFNNDDNGLEIAQYNYEEVKAAKEHLQNLI